jgi:hypothetical protein
MGQLGAGLGKATWDLASLPKLEKNFYIEDPAVSARSEAEVTAYRTSHQMVVQGRDVKKPITTFQEAGFPPYILQEILAMNFPSPSPIQCQAWPMALSGRDMVAVAETGSGKTIAFALPALCVTSLALAHSPAAAPCADTPRSFARRLSVARTGFTSTPSPCLPPATAPSASSSPRRVSSRSRSRPSAPNSESRAGSVTRPSTAARPRAARSATSSGVPRLSSPRPAG